MSTLSSKRGARGRKASSNAPTNQVQSLTRAFSLLERLSETETGMNLSELSGSVGLAPSTTHRLLSTLLQMGYVEYDDDQGVWSVGLMAFSVGNAYLKKRNFVMQARPYMRELMLQSGETCNLAILEDDAVIFISQVECRETMRMVVRIGSRGPIHATGVGKSLLSTWPEKEVLELIQSTGMQSLTPKTILSPNAFIEELSLVRARGFAIDNEEQKEGLTCIAANIYDEYGEALCAISISGPSVRITQERLPLLSGLVTETANEVTTAIGGKRPQS